MITKLLNEVNEKIETLNNLVQDKEYFEKLDERIEKANNYIQKQQQEIERLNNIINDKKERQNIAIRLLHKLFGTDDYEINYIIGIINGQRQIKFDDEILDKGE